MTDGASVIYPTLLKGLFDSELHQLHGILTAQCEESLGMAMVFDLVNTSKEWMRNRAGVVDVVGRYQVDSIKTRVGSAYGFST